MVARNHRIRFCDNNLAASSAATVTESSELASFPISNLTNSYRFKTWKTAGNFKVTSSNKTIYINDGTDKTITLTEANYTYSTLATHIQAQLNASSSNWTCTYSTTTFKFTIGRSSGTSTLRFSQTTNAAWSMLGYVLSVDTSAGTGLAAGEQRNHTSEYADIDLGVAQAVTFFSVLGPLGEVFSISTDATVRLYGNTTSDFTSPALTVTLTPDTHGIYHFLDDLEDTTYRYWRFEFSDKLNTIGPEGFKFGYLYLGDYTTIERRNVSSGFQKKLNDTSTKFVSESGALFFQSGFKFTTFETVEISYLEASDRQALEQAFYDLGVGTPFFVSFDPTLVVSSYGSELTRYVVFDSEPVFTHIKANIYSVRLSFREIN